MERNIFRYSIPVAQHTGNVCLFHRLHIACMQDWLPPVVAVRIDILVRAWMGFQPQKNRLSSEFGQIGLPRHPLLAVREIGIQAFRFAAVGSGPHTVEHAVAGRFIRAVHAFRMME